jgi:serine/threonine-protein kinase
MAERARLPARLKFGIFEADLRAAELYRQGRRVALQQQPFLLLAALLERPGEMVAREELQQRLWPADTFVDFDHGLATAVKKLRFALGDSAQNPRFVETVGGRGFRFIAPLEPHTAKGETKPVDSALFPHRAVPAAGAETRADDRFQPTPHVSSAAETTSVDGASVVMDSAASAAKIPAATLRRWAPLALLAVAAAGWAVWRARPAPEAAPRPVVRLDVLVPSSTSSHLLDVSNPDATLVVSPDGSRVVYAVRTLDRIQLFARSLSELDARPIAGTEGGAQAFFSPDGNWIGFGGDGKLKKVPAAGGAAVTLCDAPQLRGASWGEDGTILFAPRGESGLLRVAADGGEPAKVTELDEKRGETSHRWPQILPGGKAAIFTALTAGGENGVEAVVLASGERRRVLQGSPDARYLTSGHLLYASDESVFAAAFDPETLRITGPALRLPEPAQEDPNGKGLYLDVSASGTLAYLRTQQTLTELLWVDRSGHTSPASSARRDIAQIGLSPDGRRVAAKVDPGGETWIGDLDHDTWFRLNSEGSTLLWSPDGRRLLGSDDGGLQDLFWRIPGDGSAPERLTAPTTTAAPNSWPDSISPDGKLLVYGVADPANGGDLWVLPLTGDRTPRPLVQGPGNQSGSSFSPDGRFFAYTDTSSEREPCDIYVQSYPAAREQWRVTRGGGWAPKWSRDGREIFYRHGNTMFAAPVKTSPRFEAGAPRKLFETPFAWKLAGGGASYGVAPDGQRFLLLADVNGGTAQLVVVPNWADELRARLAPR